MKAMKAMKKVSARLAKRHVFAGKSTKTASGLAKGDLVKNKAGKIVSKKLSAKGKKSPWIAAVAAARKALNIKASPRSRRAPLSTTRPRPSTRRAHGSPPSQQHA